MPKLGDSGIEVQQLQKMLNVVLSVNIVIDGQFGSQTELSVKRFQSNSGLVVDGIAGPVTMNALTAAYLKLQTFAKNNSIVDLDIPLTPDQYVTYPSKKIGIVGHHTVSGGDPNKIRYSWQNDDRGKVGTHYAIGREETNGNRQFDGKIAQFFPLENYAYHIATTRMGFSTSHNANVNSRYVGIELCSWGCLKYEGGKFFDFSGRIEIPKSQVCELDIPYRTFRFWHKYSDAQLESFERLCLWLDAELDLRLGTDLNLGIKDWFEMSWDAMNFIRKFCTHGNFEAGKFDMFPQPELIATIKRIYQQAKR